MNTIPGWKLVPVEATPEMIAAVAYYCGSCNTDDQVYRVMIEAAPVPPEPSTVGDLPELPEPWIRDYSHKDPTARDHYAVDQMIDYARAAIAADRARRVGDDEPAAYMEVDGEDVFFHLGHPPDNEYSHLLTPLYLHPSTAKPDAEMVPVADYHRAIEVMCNAQKAFDAALGLPDDEDEAGPDRTLEAIDALQAQLRAALDKPVSAEPSFDHNEFEAMVERGTKAWAGAPDDGIAPDAAALVESVRNWQAAATVTESITPDNFAATRDRMHDASRQLRAALQAYDQQTGVV